MPGYYTCTLWPSAVNDVIVVIQFYNCWKLIWSNFTFSFWKIVINNFITHVDNPFTIYLALAREGTETLKQFRVFLSKKFYLSHNMQ